MKKQDDTLRNLLIASAVFFTFVWLAPRIFPPPPEATRPAPGSGESAREVESPEGADAAGPAEIVSKPPATDRGAVPEGTGLGDFKPVEAESEQTVALGSAPANGIERHPEESPYRMRLVLSNVGASIESATMTDHAEALGSPDRYQLLSLVEGEAGRSYRSLAIDRVTIDKTPVPLRDLRWQMGEVRDWTSPSGEPGKSIDFWIDIDHGDRPAVRVTRTYALPQQPAESRRHDLLLSTRIANLSDAPHSVILVYLGGIGVRVTPAARLQDQYVDSGIAREGLVDVKRKGFGDITKSAGQSLELFGSSTAEAGARFSWAATANTYFTCTIAPERPDEAANAENLAEVKAFDLDDSPVTTNDITLRFVMQEVVLAAGQSKDYPASVFLGEKDGRAFKSVPEYRSRNYYAQISEGFGICTFSWLVELMIWLLNGLHFAVRDFGVAIIILVFVVRILLHPVTKKGQLNMVRMQHRMQEMAPKIEEIKKKYANDKARMNQEMMKLNINPAGQLFTCLPMVIQMPIWVALYLSLSNNILMRHEGCVFLPWIHDLTAPDALWTLPGVITIPLVGWTIESLNVLPLLVAVFMYTQQKLQPRPAPNPNMTDQQRQQQEMMQKMGPMMSIMMLVIFYKMPAGLNLYIMTSSLFGTIEQKLIRKHIKEREEAGTLHKVGKDKASPETAKKSRKPLWLERLHKAAEDAQKMQSQRAPKAKRR